MASLSWHSAITKEIHLMLKLPLLLSLLVLKYPFPVAYPQFSHTSSPDACQPVTKTSPYYARKPKPPPTHIQTYHRQPNQYPKQHQTNLFMQFNINFHTLIRRNEPTIRLNEIKSWPINFKLTKQFNTLQQIFLGERFFNWIIVDRWLSVVQSKWMILVDNYNMCVCMYMYIYIQCLQFITTHPFISCFRHNQNSILLQLSYFEKYQFGMGRNRSQDFYSQKFQCLVFINLWLIKSFINRDKYSDIILHIIHINQCYKQAQISMGCGCFKSPNQQKKTVEIPVKRENSPVKLKQTDNAKQQKEKQKTKQIQMKATKLKLTSLFNITIEKTLPSIAQTSCRIQTDRYADGTGLQYTLLKQTRVGNRQILITENQQQHRDKRYVRRETMQTMTQTQAWSKLKSSKDQQKVQVGNQQRIKDFENIPQVAGNQRNQQQQEMQQSKVKRIDVTQLIYSQIRNQIGERTSVVTSSIVDQDLMLSTKKSIKRDGVQLSQMVKYPKNPQNRQITSTASQLTRQPLKQTSSDYYMPKFDNSDINIVIDDVVLKTVNTVNMQISSGSKKNQKNNTKNSKGSASSSEGRLKGNTGEKKVPNNPERMFRRIQSEQQKDSQGQIQINESKVY